MKKIISLLIVVLPAFILLFCTASVSEQNKTTGIQKNKNFDITVLELFTSQGCSSCPPADRLLGKYADNQNVIALSFHVDYWNRLGWKDPFSNAAYSQRQKDYAGIFKLNGVYTPQLVVNGENEMVGSDANKISNVIKKVQEQESTAHININSVKVDSNKATINYTIQGSENNSALNIALVQSEINTSIKAGENRGLNLTNYNVVRNFKTIPSVIEGTNTVSIALVPGVNKKDCIITAFLQNPQTYKISAAAKSAL
ncbi:MAG: DUF1223 domain-containing protein [Ginsengibacter sp.]